MKLMDLHRRLKEEGHITFNRQYLARLAEGAHIKIDSKTKGKTLADAKQNLYYWRGKLVKQ